MRSAAVDVLLALAVLCAWLGAAGLIRLPSAMDRLHCVAFVVAASGAAITLAAFIADGVSDRALKILAITVIGLLAGAANAHVTGRALLQRSER